jgi:hypothetical protein
VICWQQALEAVVHEIMEKETFEREQGIKSAEPRGCEGVGGAVADGA